MKLSQFGNSDIKTGDWASKSNLDDVDSFFPASSVQSKTGTAAALYAKLFAKDPTLVPDEPDLVTLVPTDSGVGWDLPAGVNNTQTVLVPKIVWTGTHYISVQVTTNLLVYATTLDGVWTPLLKSATQSVEAVCSIEYVASQNALIVTRNRNIGIVNLANGIATAYETLLVTGLAATFGSISAQPYCSWNSSLNKIVYMSSTNTTPVVISAISLDGSGLVNFANVPASHSLLNLRCVNGRTIILLHSGVAMIVKTAASGTTDFTASNAISSAVAAGSAVCNAIETDGTNIIVAFKGSTTLNYFYSNGTTWTNYTTVTPLLSNLPLNVIFFNTKWYFSQSYEGTATENTAFVLSAIGGAITPLTASIGQITTYSRLHILFAANGKLYWRYNFNSMQSTYSYAIYSSSDGLITNVQAAVVIRPSAGGFSNGYNKVTGKYHIVDFANIANFSGASSSTTLLFKFFSSTDGINYTLDKHIFNITSFSASWKNGYGNQQSVPDAGAIMQSGSYQYFFFGAMNSSNSDGYVYIAFSNDNFSTVTFKIVSGSYKGNDYPITYGTASTSSRFASANMPRSCTDGAGTVYFFDSRQTIQTPSGIENCYAYLQKMVFATNTVTTIRQVLNGNQNSATYSGYAWFTYGGGGICLFDPDSGNIAWSINLSTRDTLQCQNMFGLITPAGVEVIFRNVLNPSTNASYMLFGISYSLNSIPTCQIVAPAFVDSAFGKKWIIPVNGGYVLVNYGTVVASGLVTNFGPYMANGAGFNGPDAEGKYYLPTGFKIFNNLTNVLNNYSTATYKTLPDVLSIGNRCMPLQLDVNNYLLYGDNTNQFTKLTKNTSNFRLPSSVVNVNYIKS